MQGTQEMQAPSRGGKILWGREWPPTPVLLPGKPHGQRSLAGCSPRGLKRGGHDLATKQQQDEESAETKWVGRVSNCDLGYPHHLMATFFQRTCAETVAFSTLTPQQATTDPRLCQRLLGTHSKSGSVSWWVTRFCLCPPRAGFPSPVEVL